jgi:endonuclease-3 related protein
MTIAPSTIYKILKNNLGDKNWWPVDINYHKKNNTDPRFEIIIGTILTQNTSWLNVEKALENLKANNFFEIKKIYDLNLQKIRKLIKPSGFFNQKADRIKNIAKYLYENYNADLDIFFNREIYVIRKELLSLNGIGPETADSILLYSGNLPIFVVDAYTRRLCNRVPLRVNDKYKEIQNFFEKELNNYYSKDDITKIYNELHSLIVNLGKKYCKKKPKCKGCPLVNLCKTGQKLTK